MAIGKIKVAHVLHSFENGGLEKGVATIIRHSSNCFDHAVVCCSNSGETARLLPPAVKIWELHKSPGNSLSFIHRLARTLRRIAPDVVHTRNWAGMDGIVAARLAGIDSVVQGEHGWDINDSKGASVKRLWIRKLLSYWVKEFTCVSRDMQDWLTEKIGIKKRVTQIYNGVDTRIYHPGGDQSVLKNGLQIPQDTVLLGTVGRLDPIKDHATLFNAFSKIREKFPGTRLLVTGDGPQKRHLERIAPGGVCFMGNRHDVPDILRTLDVFVLSSINEGISNTILEAMASGLPVVATAVGGNLELVLDGVSGTLVPDRDPDALAQALAVYLKNPDLRTRHGKMGRRRALNDFNIQQMSARYEAVYRRVAAV